MTETSRLARHGRCTAFGRFFAGLRTYRSYPEPTLTHRTTLAVREVANLGRPASESAIFFNHILCNAHELCTYDSCNAPNSIVPMVFDLNTVGPTAPYSSTALVEEFYISNSHSSKFCSVERNGQPLPRSKLWSLRQFHFPGTTSTQFDRYVSRLTY